MNQQKRALLFRPCSRSRSLSRLSVSLSGGEFVPLRNLVAQLGVAAATDQLDLVRHFCRHDEEEESRGACLRQTRPEQIVKVFFFFGLQVALLAGNIGCGAKCAARMYRCQEGNGDRGCYYVPERRRGWW